MFSGAIEGSRARLLTIRILLKVSPALVALITFGTILRGLLPIAFTIVSAELIGAVLPAVRGGSQSEEFLSAFELLGILGSLFVAQQLLGPLHGVAVGRLATKLDGYLQRLAMDQLHSPRGIEHLEDPEVLDQVSVATEVGPMGITPGATIGPMSAVVGQYLEGTLAAAVLARFDWRLAVFLLTVLIAARQAWAREIVRLVKTMTGQARALRHAAYFRDLILTPPAAKETRVFGLPQWIIGRFTHHWYHAMNEVWRDRRRGTLSALTALAANWIPFGLIFLALGRASLAGELPPSEVAVFGLAVFNARALAVVGTNELRLAYGLAAVPAALQLGILSERARLPSGNLDPLGAPRQSIRFESVWFDYPKSQEHVLRGLDLEIPAGSSMAIVGANGAGKTTLMKLLCRFYDPSSGRITVDGADLRDFDLKSWQGRVGAIFQDFVRYELPARDNIGFGALEALDNQDLIAKAARLAGAEDIVKRLPGAWDTILSRRYSDGADLSGGEWQRIALARAILAGLSGCGILILDEPTANLDVRAEAEIYERFLDITQGITTILISHRFSTVRKADAICVLDDGRAIELGSHNELMAKDGQYARMFKLQSARFLEESNE